MEVKLKSCPACGGHARMVGENFVSCLKDQCDMMGPSNDPDGAKWNALPRRGDAPTVTREQIAAEILALKEGAVMLDAIGSGDLTDTLNAEDAVRARLKWLIAQPVPEAQP